MSLSVTRALTELKTLDSRINKAIQYNNWIIVKTKNKNSNVSEEEFARETMSEYQSLCDLIIRRNNVKNAILKSNSETFVEVAGIRMTVSQAIEYKKTIEYKQYILDIFKKQRQMSIVEFENYKQKLQNKIDDNIKIICGKDTKPDENTIKSISDGISKGDPIELFDPLNLNKIIKDLETEIEDFTANIDYVLSESNAITQINV